MEFYKKFKREIIGAAFGVGLTLLTQFTYNALTGPDVSSYYNASKGPDFVYRCIHDGDPRRYAQDIHIWKGTGKNQKFTDITKKVTRHGEPPTCIDDRIRMSLWVIESQDLLRKAGIYKNTPISELRIEIKK